MRTALSIAGSDSSGGAGVQADLKTMTMNGVFAMSAITALTAQNTTGVTGILEADPETILATYTNLGGLLNVGAETQTHWAVWAITSGLSFAGGVYIILSGVRLIVGEIVPAFRGIAMKLVPNAIPALDCPVLFPYYACFRALLQHGLLLFATLLCPTA